uniref:Triokinase/FMN cyclase n=1 Tax=Steinernema glaseri TaxID=37863 RepID=A0A1I7ZW64_9BILA
MEVTKKFVNDPLDSVDESIRGLVLANPSLRISESCHRVVLRAEKKTDGRVALIAGGGSGHEPFAAGFVGSGLLDAAVCGDVFASPPSDHVLAALEDVATPAGVIVFVINYTGDRLNFGLALERFHGSPKSDLVFIADDVALEAKDHSVGRRGLAGAVLLLKVAGAMSEEGVFFEEIVKTTRSINENLGTMGVSLYPCSLPGKPPMFDLPEEKMELGLGIHGEPGCERTLARSAKEVVVSVMERLVNSSKLNLRKNEKVVVLLNNLGSVSQLEMNILQKEVIEWLESFGVDIARFYSGTFMTSLDGHGVSVTILKVVDEKWLAFLDAPSECPGWKESSKPFLKKAVPTIIKSPKTDPFGEAKGVQISEETATKIAKGLRGICSKMEDFYVELNRLDGKCGDGDCGDTLLSATRAINGALGKDELTCDRPQHLFLQLSRIFEKVVGGTSGAIYALMLSAASTAFESSFSSEELANALKFGLEAIQKYGHARAGDRTMVDPLSAAVKDAAKPKRSWRSVVEAAERAAMETATMEAKAGRASYTSSETQNEADAGAMAVASWMRALLESTM